MNATHRKAMLNEEFRKIFVHYEQKSTIISHSSFLIPHSVISHFQQNIAFPLYI